MNGLGSAYYNTERVIHRTILPGRWKRSNATPMDTKVWNMRNIENL